MASEMPERASTPSLLFVSRRRRETKETSSQGGKERLTYGGHDLRLQAVLVLEARREIADAAAAVARHIRHVPDLVEHVAAGEEQDRDERDGSPDGAVPDHGEDVGPGDIGSREGPGQDHKGRDPSHPVDWPLDGWMRAVRKVAREPAVDLLCSLGPKPDVSPSFSPASVTRFPPLTRW